MRSAMLHVSPTSRTSPLTPGMSLTEPRWMPMRALPGSIASRIPSVAAKHSSGS
jgi:hypothetical protein